jgi:DNA-directed RNA polymerase specialized sigma24 family protein
MSKTASIATEATMLAFLHVWRILTRYAQKMGFSVEDAEDIASAVFAKRCKEGFDCSEGVTRDELRELLRLVPKVVRVERRKQSRRTKQLQNRRLQLETEVLEHPLAPSQADLLEAIFQVVKSLDLELRTVFWLEWEEGLSISQISSLLGICPATVYSRRARGLQLIGNAILELENR